MVDNISFIDEVNVVSRHHIGVPDNNGNNSNSNNNDVGNLPNNNNCQAGWACSSYQRLSTTGSEECMTAENVNKCTSDMFTRDRRKTDDISRLTRSVTQPNLRSKTTISNVPAVASAFTQSEKNISEEQQHSPQIYEHYSTPQSALSSCPSSYETIPNDITGEYFDARSSFSAPVELLSEFLSELMSRNYEAAFHLCKSILQYEPHNTTAREFYPLLINKIEINSACNQSTTDDDDSDANSDALYVTDREEESDNETDIEDEEEEKEKKKTLPMTNHFERSKLNNPHPSSSQSKKKPSVGFVRKKVTKTKTNDQSSSLFSANMSASNSMEFSAGIDSGRDSLPNDSDFTFESGDSLYSSTDSNLNMIRSSSTSDSLFSSNESGLTLDAVVKSVQNLDISEKHNLVLDTR